MAVVVPLSSLGNPTAIRLSVSAERVDHADGSVLAEDDAKWLQLGELASGKTATGASLE